MSKDIVSYEVEAKDPYSHWYQFSSLKDAVKFAEMCMDLLLLRRL